MYNLIQLTLHRFVVIPEHRYLETLHPAYLSHNAPITMLWYFHISFISIVTTQKSREEKSKSETFHTELENWTGQNYWHFFQNLQKYLYFKHVMLL